MARPRSTCPPSGDRAMLPTRPDRCRRPPRIGTISRPAGGRDDRSDPVAAEDGEPRHGRCDVHSQIRLPPADGPEVEAAGPVDQDGDVEVALLDRVPDVWFAGPGKDRPVHPADIVARLVRSCFPGLDTVAKHERGMTAVSAADDLVAHGELDAAEACRQVETGTRSGGHLVAGGSPGRTIGGVGVDAPAGRADGRTRSLHRLRGRACGAEVTYVADRREPATTSASHTPEVAGAVAAPAEATRRTGSRDRREQLDEDVVDREPLGQRPVGQREARVQDVVRDVVDVLRHRTHASAQERHGPGASDEPERCSRTRAVVEEPHQLLQPVRRGVARREDQTDRVVDRYIVDRDSPGRELKVDDVGRIEQARRLRWLVRHPGDDRPFLARGRIVDWDPHQEPVALRLGERVDPLRLDGVLGGHDQERARHHKGATADRDLSLRHRLE